MPKDPIALGVVGAVMLGGSLIWGDEITLEPAEVVEYLGALATAAGLIATAIWRRRTASGSE